MIYLPDELPDGLLQEAHETWLGSLTDSCETKKHDDLDRLWSEDGGEPDPAPRDPEEETVLDLSGCIRELEELCAPHGDGALEVVVRCLQREHLSLLR